MASCLREEGWDVTSHPDGSYSAEFPTEQREQFEAAEAQCAASLPNFDEPVTREQAEGYYDALLEAADCVRELGYHVDEPPSRQAAVEAIMQPIIDLGGWYPYTEAEMTASGDDLEEVYRACPPPSLY